MNSGLLASVVISLVVGYLVLSLLWPRSIRQSKAELTLKVFLAWGFGQGITACLLFVYLLVAGKADTSYIALELAVCVGLLTAWYLKRRRTDAFASLAEGACQQPDSKTLRRLLAIAFYVSVLATLGIMAARLWQLPNGEWDAWAIWNLRARAIFRSDYDWHDSLSPIIGWSHPDYPLLLPLSVVRGWLYTDETTVVPATYAWLFAGTIIGTTTAAIAILRNQTQGYVAGLALLGGAFYAELATWQYADVPLMFFILSALVLIALHTHLKSQKRGWLILAGVAAGFAAWTKNEGLLFCAALGAGHAIVVLYKNGAREYSRQLTALALGLAPLLVIIIYFKSQLAPASALTAGIIHKATLDKLADVTRYVIVAKEFGRQFLLHKGYGIGLIYVLLVYIVCMGMTRQAKTFVAAGAIVLIVMMLGYFMIYITTPFALQWHLQHSVDRVLLQLWPAFVFTLFLLVAAPEELAGEYRE